MTQDKKDFIEAMLTWFRSPKVGNDEELDRAFLSDAYDSITCSHWISVDDELPKKDGRYLFYNEVLGPQVSVYYDGCTLVSSITHWMPMPQAPHHIIDANKKVDRVIGTADHIKTALDVLNKEGGGK